MADRKPYGFRVYEARPYSCSSMPEAWERAAQAAPGAASPARSAGAMAPRQQAGTLTSPAQRDPASQRGPALQRVHARPAMQHPWSWDAPPR